MIFFDVQLAETYTTSQSIIHSHTRVCDLRHLKGEKGESGMAVFKWIFPDRYTGIYLLYLQYGKGQ